MNQGGDPVAYMSKAQRIFSTAEMLLRGGDTEGACNRAYYAMFNAAHVALLFSDDTRDLPYKTHHGLIAAFGKHVVLSGRMDPDFGGALNEGQRLRQIADYVGEPPDLKTATRAVARAGDFLEAIRTTFMTPQDGT